MPADPRETEANLDTPVEIVISRTLSAPRELVWLAWTDPKHAGQWWGPAGFTTTTHSIDFRPGGSWRYTMHGPDGRDYKNRITYLEIVKPSRLVYKHGGDEGGEPVRFHTDVAFDSVGASGSQTRVTMRSIFSSAEERDFVIKTYNAVEGGKQHLANLADYLQNLSEGEAHEPPFSTSRVLRAPRDRVWQAWTDREELFRWFGPKGANLSHAELDLRPGGSFHYGVNHPSGMTIWGRWVFREISPSHKLVFLSCFSDPDGRIARAPFPGFESYPAEMLSTVSFAEHAGLGKGTLVTYEAQPFQASQEERDFFRSCHDSLRQGWGGTLEQLADYLGA